MTRTGHLVLIGMMGAGKTEVGRVCADRLGRPFVDTDELVESTTGMSIADIFAEQGEPWFREREVGAVARACASETPSVIACGGGAVLAPENRRALGDAGFVVWLRARPETLAARVGHVEGRPLLAGASTPELRLRTLAEERERWYRETADAVVDTDELDLDVVVDAVLEHSRAEGGAVR